MCQTVDPVSKYTITLQCARSGNPLTKLPILTTKSTHREIYPSQTDPKKSKQIKLPIISLYKHSNIIDLLGKLNDKSATLPQKAS